MQSLCKGLQDLLSHKEDDIESVFMLTFRISYKDVFGTVLIHDLKENGDKILVNQSNKEVSTFLSRIDKLFLVL